MSDEQDYSEHYLRADKSLLQSYISASKGNMAAAIRLAWAAEKHAKAYAESLESSRVEMDRLKRAAK